jgi:phosphonopyruvate decarboxylase
VVRRGYFDSYSLQKQKPSRGELTREAAIEEIVNGSDPKEIYFSTTGMASRELWELRERQGGDHSRDFLTVGSMGHASQIALGAALQKPDLHFTCLDGDGAVLMHLGGLGIIGSRKPGNFRHIVLNNGAHDSVGGQPTVGQKIDLATIARACGYAEAVSSATAEELRAVLQKKSKNPLFIEVKVRKGNRSDLGRPTSTLVENKEALMKTLKGAQK